MAPSPPAQTGGTANTTTAAESTSLASLLSSSSLSLPSPSSSSSSSSAAAAAAAAGSNFTPEMRDRQARFKDPYDSDSEDGEWPELHGESESGSGDENGGGGGGGGAGAEAGLVSGNTGPRRDGSPKRHERFLLQDRRRMAAQILDSPELLMMASLRDDLSYPATRLKYTRILCGLEEPSPPASGAGRPSRSPAAPAYRSAPRRRGGNPAF
ncbi:hypothetical protein F5Y14DRAFT_430349 [Nemania sp. NC0429]|nr:hypothetical protein F5Y14DRAFT_430349 [Nemania sp. NC0429]